MQHKRSDVRWRHASNAGCLAKVLWPELVEFFTRLLGHGGDCGVIQVLWQLTRVLGRNLLELPLLAVDKAGVLDVHLHALLLHRAEPLVPQPVLLKQAVVDVRPAQDHLQGGGLLHALPGDLARRLRQRAALAHPRLGEALLLGVDVGHLGREEVVAAVVDEAGGAADLCEARVRVVRPQQQPVLRPRGQHAVRLPQVLGDEVVDERADVAALAGQHQQRLARRVLRRVHARHQPLRRRLLVPGGAVELAREEEALDGARLQGVLALHRREEVVLHRVRRPEHLARLQPRQRPQHRQLKALRQAGGETLHVNLRRVASFGLEEDLVGVLVGEAHDLVLDAGAVARPARLHPPPIGGGLVQVVADQLVRGQRGARQVAAHLLLHHVRRWIVAEPTLLVVPGLRLQHVEVDGAAVHPRGGPRLQAVRLEAELLQRLRQALAGGLPRTAGGHALPPHPNVAVHERARGEHHRGGHELHSEERRHPSDVVVVVNNDVGHHRFANVQVLRVLYHLPHHLAVLLFVCLGAQSPHSRTFGPVQDALLDVCAVCHFAHLTT
mmetsp:Transcript_34667/g.75757  ORF Transcript_34667/g.75757 Transcript_34667/m.75757 type:complete len:553 (+) Transcript_34667:397-2055(+)